MAWTDGVDRAVNYIITAANWNALLGAAGSLMQLKSHQHGGTTGEGSQSIGPLVLEDFTDAAAPAAPGAGKTRIYAVTGKPRYRAGAAGTDRALITDETTAAGDLAGTYPNPTIPNLIPKTIVDAKGDLIVATAADAVARRAVGADGTHLTADSTQADGVKWSVPVLTTAEAALSADVSIPTAGTYVDGPSVSLAAGTWFIVASVCVVCSAGTDAGAGVIAKLWDGTTVEASGELRGSQLGSLWGQLPLAGIVVLGGTTTMTVSATVTTDAFGAGAILAATPNSGSGNNASHIRAVRVA